MEASVGIVGCVQQDDGKALCDINGSPVVRVDVVIQIFITWSGVCVFRPVLMRIGMTLLHACVQAEKTILNTSFALAADRRF